MPLPDLSVVFLLSLCGALSDLSVNFPRFLTEQVASCSQKKSMPNGHVLIFLCVGETTFGPVAEGVRRQDVRSNEADVKSKRGDGLSRGSSGRKTKTGEDRATQAS